MDKPGDYELELLRRMGEKPDKEDEALFVNMAQVKHNLKDLSFSKEAEDSYVLVISRIASKMNKAATSGDRETYDEGKLYIEAFNRTVVSAHLYVETKRGRVENPSEIIEGATIVMAAEYMRRKGPTVIAALETAREAELSYEIDSIAGEI